MNKTTALKIMNINNFDEYDYEKLKKQYKKISLKKHPDKGGSHKDFIELSMAYDVLTKELDSGNNDNIKDDDIFTLFTKIILTHNKTNIDQNAVKEKILKFVNMISGKLLNKVDKDNLIFLKQIIDKYNYYFDKDIYDELINIINEKTDNIKVYNLTPSIDDLFLDNIFNLNINKESKKTLLIPLWHNELTYDISGETIIVQITPNLPEYCNIDINNNIHYYFSRKLDSSILENDEMCFEINNKKHYIQTNKVYIKKNQNFVFKEEGISRISNNDIFDNSDKSDLIINLTLY
uniref:J domain-containing protein n=1 Tax=viral metagenome TaxID=1070528 RepID=A0A6C0BS86_9ZZZZ